MENTCKIIVNIVPVISGNIDRKALKDLQTDRIQDIVNSVDLADTLPTENEKVSVQLLIEMTITWTSSTVRKLRSSLYYTF